MPFLGIQTAWAEGVGGGAEGDGDVCDDGAGVVRGEGGVDAGGEDSVLVVGEEDEEEDEEEEGGGLG